MRIYYAATCLDSSVLKDSCVDIDPQGGGYADERSDKYRHGGVSALAAVWAAPDPLLAS
ncbi:hypothetical protein AB0H00_24345 [Nocardia sp. NPDC023852]|uniref:hypothetical protein n=1 Tax=Nocardia sp. NPDC023852 TaxID=3154697 RepID=UPI0033E88D10